MKKILKISLLSLLLVGVGNSVIKKVNSQIDNPLVVKDETFIGADFSSGIYTYELDRKFDKSFNTIETWVRLGKLAKGEAGGVIFGNYEYYNTHSINLEIDVNRNVVLKWNSEEVVVKFDEYTLATDEWTYLSVVRDQNNSRFSLYVNGILAQTVNSSTGGNFLSDFKYIIGGDWANWRAKKNVFNGEIGQVTVYSSALSSREVYQDYIAENNISSNNRKNLMFNTELRLNDRELKDTSENENHAVIRSNEYFYKGEVFAAKDYSMAIIPDPQVMSHWAQGNLKTISEYIIDKNETHNVAMTLCVGDNADNVSSSRPDLDMDFQLSAVKREFDNLYAEGIRWATTPGNHDYDSNATVNRNLTYYNKYFAYEEISKYDYFGGAYQIGQTQNAYYLFEECGVPYLIISIEFGADDNVLAWANNVVSNYPERRAIVFTHAYMGGDNEILSKGKSSRPTSYGFNAYVDVNDADDMFNDFISLHENIFMVFSGHVPSDDILVKESYGIHGNTVMQFLIDAQGIMMTGCESLVSLITFDELNQKVYINYESTTTRELFNIQNQFELSFEGKTEILSSVYYEEDGTLKKEFQ